LFWIEGNAVCTPPLAAGILPGVTRAVVLEICEQLGYQIRESNISVEKLKRVDGIFLSLSSFGIVEIDLLDRSIVKASPISKQIQEQYQGLLARNG